MKGFDRNNIKVSYKGRPVFYINEPKRCISCKLKAAVLMPSANSWEGISLNSFLVEEVGTAKCHKNDTFDLERGKKIALAKAKSAVYLAAVHKVDEQYGQLKFLSELAEDFIGKGYACVAVNQDYVDKLSMPGHPEYIKTIEKPIVDAEIAKHTRK